MIFLINDGIIYEAYGEISLFTLAEFKPFRITQNSMHHRPAKKDVSIYKTH